MQGRCAGPWCAWITTPFCLHLGPNQAAALRHTTPFPSLIRKITGRGSNRCPEWQGEIRLGVILEGGYPRGLIMFRKGGWVSCDSDIGSGRTRKVSRMLLSGGWGARTREHENKIFCMERDTTEQAEMTTTPSAPVHTIDP